MVVGGRAYCSSAGLRSDGRDGAGCGSADVAERRYAVAVSAAKAWSGMIIAQAAGRVGCREHGEDDLVRELVELDARFGGSPDPVLFAS